MAQPPRAQTGDELLRQSGLQPQTARNVSDIPLLNQQVAIAPQTNRLAGFTTTAPQQAPQNNAEIQSLTEGLAARRLQEQQLIDFQQGAGAENLAAIQGQERAPLQDPTIRLQAEQALRVGQASLLEKASQGSLTAMAFLESALEKENKTQEEDVDLTTDDLFLLEGLSDGTLKFEDLSKEDQKTANKASKVAGVSLPETAQEGTKSEGAKEIIGIVDELLLEDTKPITGTSRFKAEDGTFIEKRLSGIEGLFATLDKRPQKMLSKFNQLKSKLSLEGREALKGTGTISDFEAGLLAAASNAITREMSDEDFRTELKNLKSKLENQSDGEERIRVRLKATGQEGSIPESEFSESEHERI